MVATDYQKLLQAVVDVCMNSAGKSIHPTLVLAFHHLTQFAPDFPRGVVFKKEGSTNYHRIYARRLLDWLRINGHTTLTAEDIGNASLRFTTMEKELFNGLV